MVALREAVGIVLSGASPLEPEFVELSGARGRITAIPVESRTDLPPFDNSAMDGFAVRSEDLGEAGPESPVELRLAGEARAGMPWQGRLEHGEAIGISTGAMLPDGANSILRIENVRLGRDAISVDAGIEAGRDIRRRGEVARIGEVLLRAGSRIGAAETGVLAAAGEDPVSCIRRPRVRLLTCGDELVEPGIDPGPGQIRNSNQAMIAVLVEESGGVLVGAETVPDQLDDMVEGLSTALDADLTVVCGGVSVGEHDHAAAAFERLGISGGFSGVLVRPGQPARFGRRGHSRVLGLPGNPFSALVIFRLLASPFLSVACGRGTPVVRKSGLAAPLDRLPGSFRAVPCRATEGASAGHLVPVPMAGPHDLAAIPLAECLALVPPGEGQLMTGSEVEVIDLRGRICQPR